MKIRVDNREQELLKHIRELIVNIPLFKDLEVQVENLPLGDVIISNNVEDKLYIERKSINDLAASIKDGRYEEQSFRLNGLNHPNHNIIYLIEGDVNRQNRFKDNKMEKLTLYSSIFSLNEFSVDKVKSSTIKNPPSFNLWYEFSKKLIFGMYSCFPSSIIISKSISFNVSFSHISLIDSGLS